MIKSFYNKTTIMIFLHSRNKDFYSFDHFTCRRFYFRHFFLSKFCFRHFCHSVFLLFDTLLLNFSTFFLSIKLGLTFSSRQNFKVLFNICNLFSKNLHKYSFLCKKCTPFAFEHLYPFED